MNLYNPMTTINKMTRPFEHPYKGIVVQVDQDPEYIGRIKVDIPELFGEYQEGLEGIYPWIYPRFFGKFAGKIQFSVPEKGDVVEVDFPYKNVYVGYYTNKPMYKDIWDTLIAIDPEEGQAIVDKFKAHYPDVYGHIDRNLTGWYVDKVTNEIFLVQGGKKANITLDAEGSIIVNSPKDMIFTAGNNIEFHATNDFIVTSTNYDNQASSSYNMKSAAITTDGPIDHTGTITVSEEVTAGENKITLTGHKHPTAAPGSPSTPIP